MRSLLLAVATGLVGALVLHIVIVFAIPYFASDDAWSRIRALDAQGRFVSLAESSEAGDALAAGSISESAFTRTVVCRYEIEETPIHLVAEGNVPFWSLGVFDPRSNELFSMNDRTSENGGLNVALASPTQMIALREAVPQPLATSVLIEVPLPSGYVVLRTVVPDETWRSTAAQFLESARCEPVDGA